MAANLGELGNAYVSIDLDQAGFGRQLDGARAQFRRTADRMGSDMSAVGRGLVGVGGAMVAAVAGAVKVASDFESAFAGVRKTVDATEAEFQALERGIADMAEEIPVARTELARIMEIAGQLGVRGTDNLLKFTRVAADLGATTNLSSEAAATALARFVNVTGGSLSEVDRLGSTIVALGNNFATTESEITEMTLRLAGLAPAAGFTQPEILALAAALSSVGVEAELGGTAIQRLVIDMVKAASEGGETLALFSEVAGMTAEAFAEMVKTDPGAALRSFFEGLNRINESGGNVFATLEALGISEQRMIQVLTKAAGATQVFADASTLAGQAFAENTALTDEANKRYETFASQLVIAKNAFMNLVGEIGTPAMQALATVLKEQVIPALQETVSKVAAWIEKNPELAGKILLAVGAIGALAIVLGTVLVALGSVAAAVAALIGPVGAVAAAIAIGLVAGFVNLMLMTDAAKERLQGFMSFLINVFTGQWAAAWEQMKAAFSRFWTWITSKIDSLLQKIRNLQGAAAAAFNGALSAIPGGSLIGAALGMIPGGATGGSILKGGIIDVHAGERIYLPEAAQIQRAGDAGSFDRASSAPVVHLNFNGDVYGPEDLLSKVDAGLSQLLSQKFKALGVAL